MSPVSSDVVVALGGGMTAGGQPRPATVARALRAAGLYRSGRAARIVMSGAYGMYGPLPPRLEATAMAEIAAAAGVPPGSITAETRSRGERSSARHAGEVYRVLVKIAPG